MNVIQTLRGTKDLIGAEASAWDRIEQTAAQVFARFGYTPIRTPLIEEEELFKRSVGEVTDIVQKEMYSFEDRSGQRIALRPEGTASVVRAFIEHGLGNDVSINRLHYCGPMFRAERPQKGRQRQFHQIGAELLGSNSPLADVEAIEVLVRILEALGISGFEIQINNLGSFEDRENFSAELKKYFETHRETLSKDSQARLDKNVFRILDSKHPDDQKAIQGAPSIGDFISTKSREDHGVVLQLLADMGIRVKSNPRIVRGLDYYTHMVFELNHPDLGAQDALAAGGRYDRLVSKLGGKDTPAVGFAMGVERLMILLAQKEVAPSTALKEEVYAAGIGAGAANRAAVLASKLRNSGLSVKMELGDRSLKACLRQANKWGSRYAMIVGESELASGQVMLKDLGDGSQEIVNEDRLITLLTEKHAKNS